MPSTSKTNVVQNINQSGNDGLVNRPIALTFGVTRPELAGKWMMFYD